MLKSMRLRNLRSFPDDESLPFVDIKPLTVLLGKNSSGKSSFLRSFPLFRQSVEGKASGPVLWYGSYVDFGAFSEAKMHNSDTDIISFDFKLSIDLNRRKNFYLGQYHEQNEMFGRGLADIEVSIGVSESNKKTVANQVVVKIDSFEYLIKFDGDDKCQLFVNGDEFEGMESLNFISVNSILPVVGRFVKFERDFNGSKQALRRFHDDYVSSYFSDLLIECIRGYFHPNTTHKTISDGIDRLGVCTLTTVVNNLGIIFRGNKTFVKNLSNYGNEIYPLVYELLLHRSLTEILAVINSDLEDVFKGVRYIAPLRATAERYYRHQDLRVDEIDHTGSNLAMLLRSFSASENIRFSSWTMENFGFSVKVLEQGLHYSLIIKTGINKKEYNINDMGFGFSQILPIVAAIWMEIYRKDAKRSRGYRRQVIFTIEQPELHLHPEYQARLARMFASVIKIAKENKFNLIILFETHSKSMIDSIGDCIEEKIISERDVNIALFEKNIEETATEIKFSKFNSSGYLLDWPIGFFSGR
jgi:predicted ATPase